MIQLGPTENDKRSTWKVVLRLMRGEGRLFDTLELAAAAAQLNLNEDRKCDIREALLEKVSVLEDLSDTKSIAEKLIQLDPSVEDKRRLRKSLLALLSCEPRFLKNMLATYAQRLLNEVTLLDPTVQDLTTWQAWPTPPHTEFIIAARLNSMLDDWLSALPILSALSSWPPQYDSLALVKGVFSPSMA
jgi:hypothetical protein